MRSKQITLCPKKTIFTLAVSILLDQINSIFTTDEYYKQNQ